MRHLRQVGAVLMLMLVATSVVSAQARRQASAARPWELGADAALSFGLDDPNVTTIEIPLQRIRAGLHVSEVLSIEPFFGLNYTKFEDVDAITTYEFGAGALYHFSESRTQSQLFVRPELLIVGFSAGGNSDSELGAGVGVGMKWPRLGGRMAWRGEAGIRFINEQTIIRALFGVSFFTR